MSYTSTILVTGGTSGLGFEAALALAKQKPDSLILIASRSSGTEAVEAINKQTGRSNVKYLKLDLSSLEDVRHFVAEFAGAKYPPISALLLNAGIQIISGVTYTKEGIETTFGVNHVGHALLFHLLLLHFAPGARVIVTSSGTHDPAQTSLVPAAVYENAEKLAHPDKLFLQKNNGRQRYSTSKLCNVLWTYAVDKRRKELSKDFNINAFDPGLMPGTGLARDAGALPRFLWHSVLPRLMPLLRLTISHNTHTPKESGEALARLAVGEDVKGVSGKYFEGRKEIESSKDSNVEAKQEDLWKWTVNFVGQGQEEQARFEKLA